MDAKESRRVNNTGGEFLATASKRAKRDWNFVWVEVDAARGSGGSRSRARKIRKG